METMAAMHGGRTDPSTAASFAAMVAGRTALAGNTENRQDLRRSQLPPFLNQSQRQVPCGGDFRGCHAQVVPTVVGPQRYQRGEEAGDSARDGCLNADWP
jgi:hypothetical protein